MKQKCCGCHNRFEYTNEETWWDYKGMDYDAKLVRCPDCGAVNVIKYLEMPDREEWLIDLDLSEIKVSCK